ncbi:Uncharacterised protein [Capnocytophaga ochracea]|uniref:Uncharacterized protein n=1 Tax=Capnocytophaga ochracea TaxID=1018 RepID=A0A2X2RFW4_CAPOC|nr:hypothetical protein [Capnocytophaga ochracea]SQA77337.1 Uncharacterised protein [Capnocytophaga ochracea]
MSHKIIKFGMLALVALALTYCQREDAPEAPQQAPVPTVAPQAVVSLNEAKSLFEASENQKRTANSVSRRKYPFIELETDWRYFVQTQTLVGDAYSKIPVTIVGSDLSAEILFLKKDGITEQTLFVTKVDSLTSDNRIVNADFYLFTPKGEFISAYRMKEGVITHELVPKYKGRYRLVVDTEVAQTSRVPKARTRDNLFRIACDCGTESNSEGDCGCAQVSGGGYSTILLDEVTLYGKRKKRLNNPFEPYPNYNDYEFTDPYYDEDFYRGGRYRGGECTNCGGGGGSNVGAGMAKEEEKKEEAPVPDRPDHPISDNKCFFSTVDLNKGATLTIYVDEPKPGTGGVIKWINVGHTFIGITQGENQYTYGFYPNVPGIRTIGNNDVSSVLGKDDRHTFSVSFSAEISPEQLQKIIELSQKSYARQYNLSSSNCTDFAISVAKLAGITLPYSKSNWGIGSGSNPGALGKALRDSPTFKDKINTNGGTAPASKGNGC